MTDDEVVNAMLRNHAFICKTERLPREVLGCAIARLKTALEEIDRLRKELQQTENTLTRERHETSSHITFLENEVERLEEELQMLRLGDEF